MTRTILVVDDKASVRTLLREYLSEQGFRVVQAANGCEGLMVARQEQPDLIILDVMMPELDGYEFIRRFRREHETPIILLTAKLEETDKVIGLELGADDYVTKPFGMAELLARVRAVLRRLGRSADTQDVLRAGPVTLDRGTRLVSVEGRNVDLTPSEFELLGLLIGSPGRVFSRAELLDHLQGNSYAGVERTIDVHIRNLRTKIEPDPSQPRFIQTVFGVGYRFLAESS